MVNNTLPTKTKDLAPILVNVSTRQDFIFCPKKHLEKAFCCIFLL